MERWARWLWILFLPAQALAGARDLPEEAQACLACHGQPNVAPTPDLRSFPSSAHSSLACTACHEGAVQAPHPAKPGPVDCGLCHAQEDSQLKGSTHGRALRASCEACHGPGHAILPIADSASPMSKARQPSSCGGCHEDASKVPESLARKSPLKSYLKTIHGEVLAAGNQEAAVCSDCHGSHAIEPPGRAASKVSHAEIPATCGACHAAEAKEFAESVHGKALARGEREAPSCTDCHGEHSIRPPGEKASSVYRGAITKTCAGCHGSEKIASKFGLPLDRVQTYLDSFHGLAGKTGDLEVANCASCHGWHDVRPSSDPASRTNPANLSKTCGQCHSGASAGLGRVHVALSREGEGSAAARFFRRFYLVVIPLALGAMGFHNLLDLLRKAVSRPLRPLRAEQGEVLLTVPERLQHGGLILTFGLLAYSGFALKYSGAWWSLPFSLLGGDLRRRLVHRAAAAAFVLLGGFHLGWLSRARRGRARLEELRPRFEDLSDALALFRFNFGISTRRPVFARFSYIEKAEYWGLVWGSAVMVATGAVLVFHNFALARLPLWVVESARVIHFMEAALACLSIGVWHFYWVIFDPEVYPMNWAWLFGRAKLKGEP